MQSNQTLQGTYIDLVPFDKTHIQALTTLYQGEGETIFSLTPYKGSFTNYLEEALNAQATATAIAYTVFKKDGTVCGMSRYLDIDPENKSLEIGHTWYHPDHWATKVNPDAKLTLLTNAFETMHMHRIQFKTDARNTRSQSAIKKLGAKYEGTLRCHRILPDGTRRDSVYFSIITDEWPEVKARLTGRLNQY